MVSRQSVSRPHDQNTLQSADLVFDRKVVGEQTFSHGSDKLLLEHEWIVNCDES